jgi:two-component system sensor histidine kinase DesK
VRLLPDDPDIGWAAYIWLAYLVFVFLGPVFAGNEEAPSIWVWSVVASVCFVPIYFLAYWVRGVRLLGVAIVMCGFGAALSGLNIGGNTFFIFAGYFAARAAPTPRWAPLYLATIAIALLLTSIYVQPLVYFWGPPAIGVLVVGALAVFETQRGRYTADLRLARAEVEALARIAERDRIARDLHDLLGHSLSIIALKSELAQRLLDKDLERVRTELVEVQDVARQALAEVRTAVRGYRVGSGAGLRHELDNAARSLETAGVKAEIACGPEAIAPHLDAEHEGVLALALREATTNVIRHAGATTCRIAFVSEGDTYGFDVQDDGRGSHGHLGFGLQGMRVRVQSLGGWLDYEASHGTLLRVRFRNGARVKEAVS